MTASKFNLLLLLATSVFAQPALKFEVATIKPGRSSQPRGARPSTTSRVWRLVARPHVSSVRCCGHSWRSVSR
jgi:hypothetical protein